jgi:uncharacterized protein
MIALDTNILVYAHRADSPLHAGALAAVERAATGTVPVGVPWACVHEFLAIVTHPRIYDPPSTTAEAWNALDALLDLPHVHLLAEGHDHRGRLRDLVESSGVTGPKVHDARIAAVCSAHGVSELWTADRDFSWFPTLRTHNPLLGG